ncbi:hypothetical protein EBR77_04725 [bacterium]|nr:hypothetical protein [bacterium]
MYCPPEKYLPAEKVNEQLVNSLRGVSEASKKAFDDGITDNYYRIPEKPFLMAEDNYKNALKQLNVSIVYRSGDVIDGKLIIEADRYTVVDDDGTPPSYFLSLQTEKGKRPLNDIYGHPMRYRPDLSGYLAEEKAKRDEIVRYKKRLEETATLYEQEFLK